MASVTALAFHRDGRQMATGTKETTVRIWDAMPLPAHAAK
jgi:WD40 repeat protein